MMKVKKINKNSSGSIIYGLIYDAPQSQRCCVTLKLLSVCCWVELRVLDAGRRRRLLTDAVDRETVCVGTGEQQRRGYKRERRSYGDFLNRVFLFCFFFDIPKTIRKKLWDQVISRWGEKVDLL